MLEMATEMKPFCWLPYATYPEFQTWVTDYRELERSEFLKRAGFSEAEVDEYRLSFQAYDRSGDGEMSVTEIMPLLKELGRAPTTPAARDRLTEMLDEIDDDKTGEISFSEFLQLMRKFNDEQDAQKFAKEKACSERAEFSGDDINQ